MWKPGFYLMMGQKKKKVLFSLPVKQYPDVVLFAVGVSDLNQGRRITPTSLCKCCPLILSVRASLLLIFSDYTVLWVDPRQLFSFVGREISLGCRKAKLHWDI